MSLPFTKLQSSGFLTVRIVVQHGAAAHFDQPKQCLHPELLIAKVSENTGWPHHAKWPILPLWFTFIFPVLLAANMNAVQTTECWECTRVYECVCVDVMAVGLGMGGVRGGGACICMRTGKKKRLTKFDFLKFEGGGRVEWFETDGRYDLWCLHYTNMKTKDKAKREGVPDLMHMQPTYGFDSSLNNVI